MDRSSTGTTMGMEETSAMKYWDGYKFVVAEDFSVQTTVYGYDIVDKFFHLHPDGKLDIYLGYPWDGNSGPFPDIGWTIEASCGHDILCDLVNSGKLPLAEQPKIDQFYYDTVERKGMWPFIARQITLTIRWHMLKKGSKRFNRKVYEA